MSWNEANEETVFLQRSPLYSCRTSLHTSLLTGSNKIVRADWDYEINNKLDVWTNVKLLCMWFSLLQSNVCPIEIHNLADWIEN